MCDKHSLVMTASDPFYLLFEPVYSSLAVTTSSLHFNTTCMHSRIVDESLIFTVSSNPVVIKSLNHLSLGELLQSTTRTTINIWFD